ncbi:MAG: DUF6544 family protein [Gemmatimonadota bacterium]|nr:DUF6544 family protein [Gemmatimonadota bacterium]
MPAWPSILGAAAGGIAGAVAVGWTRERNIRNRLLAALEAEAGQQAPNLPDPDRSDLPPPVGAYLRRALPPDPRPIVLARLTQRGRIRTDPLSDRWLPFAATHVAAPRAPGFVWDARVSTVPGVHIRVVDSFVSGEGRGRVAVASTVPLGSAGPGVEMNEAALQRLLAEGPWTPSLLLPSERLRWSARSDDSAEATLSTDATTVSVEFTFNEEGEIGRIYTPARWRSVRGGFEPCAWEGRFADYTDHDGWRIPRTGEVGWHIGGEWRSVFECTIDSIEFEMPI